MSDLDYAFEFETNYAKFEKPDGVIVLVPNYLLEEHSGYFDDPDSTYSSNIDRFGTDVGVELIGFNGHCELKFGKSLHGGLNLDRNLLAITIIQEGLKHLTTCYASEVIRQAPIGTAFAKPSKETYQEFIQASALARSSDEVAFVAASLLWFRPKRNIRRIAIDTAGISNVAEALTHLLYRLDGLPYPTAVYFSFESYSGLEKFQPENPDDVWAIISASTSNNLGKAMVKSWHLKDDQIVTILSYADRVPETAGTRIACNVSEFSRNAEIINPQLKVQIVGDFFTPVVAEPKCVMISVRHRPLGLDLLKENTSGGVISCNVLDPKSDVIRPLRIDIDKSLISTPRFKRWLNQLVGWNLPATFGSIIYDDLNPAGAQMLECFNGTLEELGLQSPSHVLPRSAGDFSVLSNPDSTVILAPHIVGGRSLLRLNGELRAAGHTGNRHFLVGLSSMESKGASTVFERSLSFGPDGKRYPLFVCNELNLDNHAISNPWIRERMFVGRLNDHYWQKRHEVLNQPASGLGGLIGCHTNDPTQQMSFSADFAFWRNIPYDPDTADPEAVYLTIASVLQNARDNDSGRNTRDSLENHLYQQTVLDPQNFVRFDDPLLQACLWRAARDSELDYSGSTFLSQLMADFVLQLFSEMGESALDLLLALALGRIKIHQDHLHQVLNAAQIAKWPKPEPARELVHAIGS